MESWPRETVLAELSFELQIHMDVLGEWHEKLIMFVNYFELIFFDS